MMLCRELPVHAAFKVTDSYRCRQKYAGISFAAIELGSSQEIPISQAAFKSSAPAGGQNPP